MVLRYAVRTSIVLSLGFLLTACAGGGPPATSIPVEATTRSIVTVAPGPAESPVATLGPICDGMPTLAQTEGPYYKAGSPERFSLVEADTVGEVLILTGRVLTMDCDPVVGAVVDVWQADGVGVYDNDGYRLRGRVRSDGDGVYEIETVVPGEYPGRTPHIHIKVFGPDGSERLTTQIYLAGISDQVADSIFSNDLLAIDLPPGADGTRRIQFEIVLAA
jgi:protocatechuate 3,4-dioxygenase beta subunit